MYNVLIVDDETIIRERISQLVRNFLKKCTVFCASNGREAIEIICSAEIDIIFADMKMPVFDGIEMLKKLSSLGYDGQIVIISGFGDYALVRKAMKLGAVDYIMKPIDESEFYTALNECISKIQNSNYVNNFYSADKVKEIIELLFAQQRIISQLINNDIEPKDFLRKYNLVQYTYVTVFVMDVFRPGYIPETEKRATFLRIEALFQECFKSEAILIQGEFKKLWVVIIFISSHDRIQLVNEFCGYLLKEQIKFGACKKILPVNKLSLAYSAAISSLEEFFYDISVENCLLDEAYPCEATIAPIVDSICNCDFNSLIEKLYYLFSIFCYHKPKVEYTRQLLANIVYNVMKHNTGYISIIGKYKFTENDIIHIIESSLSASQIRKKMISIFSLYMSEYQEKQRFNDEYVIKKVKKHIELGYNNNITLTQIAEKLGFNPNYLSTLFKQKTGMTFSDYLRGFRVNKAIELMRTSNLKLYEIASMIGYSDTAHFYRAFKKEKGMSPGNYQKNIDPS